MGQFRGLSGGFARPKLDAPSLTPRDMQDAEMLSPESIQQIGADGTTTNQTPLAPLSEARVMIADRATANFRPGPSYANVDPQKGGAPGNPGGNTGKGDATESFITSQGPDGVTSIGGAPVSPLKLSYGFADWREATPVNDVAMHVAINKFANPNRPQVNPTPFNTEGPNQNTRYTAPAPWAAGVFIG